jgi:hypothetical protein
MKKILLFFAAFFVATLALFAQKKLSPKQVEIKNCIDSQQYIFRAQQAIPMSGQTRNLTTEYDMQVTPDSITTFLPYFGRAYNAPLNPTDGGGIKIKTKNFDYAVKVRKNGGWEITIKPKETQDVQQMYLTVSVNGYATLQITSVNRQPISFYGYISNK